MGMNHTPIDNSMTKDKAISQGGYYNTDGDWNCVLTLEEYPNKIFRGRVEVLVFKEGKVFMFIKNNGTYRVPGGGFDRGVLNKDQAFIETKEEAKILISNIRETGVKYLKFFKDKFITTERDIDYDGSLTEVYIADYKGEYEGRIRKGLSDNELTNKGKFYDLDEVKDILTEPHKQALNNILNNILTESVEGDLILTAKQFQTILRNLHNKVDSYHCIQNVDIESDDGGYVFAQYITSNPYEVNEVKKFIKYCNEIIKTTIYTGYVDEPQTYKSGFLFIKNDINESRYFYPYIESEEFITEATKQIKKGKYPIFIVNSYTGTPFGKVIAAYTKSEYNHSSISLDSSLSKLYSFNLSGFVQESLDLFISLNKNSRIQVRCLFVEKTDIMKIKERLDYLWSYKDKAKYNIENIINIILNKPTQTSQDSLSMICSEFVSWILSFADIKLLDKSFNLVTPKDLSKIQSPKLYLLYEGYCRDYDHKRIDRIFKKLKQKSELYKQN